MWAHEWVGKSHALSIFAWKKLIDPWSMASVSLKMARWTV